MKQKKADGIGGMTAVEQKILKPAKSLRCNVHAERVEERIQRLAGKTGARGGFSESHKYRFRRIAPITPPELLPPFIKSPEPLVSGNISFISEIVGCPRKSVNSRNIGAHLTRNHERSHRKVLVVRPCQGLAVGECPVDFLP